VTTLPLLLRITNHVIVKLPSLLGVRANVIETRARSSSRSVSPVARRGHALADAK
jgi:hypothetical protein